MTFSASPPVSRRVFFAAVALSGCAPHKLPYRHSQKPFDVPLPEPFVRPLDKVAAEFGSMVLAYEANAAEIMLDVDLLDNQTGISKEFPLDLSGYVRAIVSHIEGFATTKVLSTTALVPGGLLAPQEPRPNKPPPRFRIVGSLRRASEVEAVAKSFQINVLAGHKPQGEGQITAAKTVTTTSVVVQLGIERDGGVSKPGDFATFRVPLDRSEVNNAGSGYLVGSGIGSENRTTITGDFDSGTYDALAMSLITILGRALLLPFWRLGNGKVFPVDTAVETRKKNSYLEMGTRKLEAKVKGLMYSDDFSLDPSLDATDSDRAVMKVAMQGKGLQYNDAGLAEFAFMLWRSLDYLKGASRATERSINAARVKNQQVASAPQKAAVQNTVVDGSTFGWAKDAPIMIIDMHLIEDGLRPAILATVKTCPGFADAKEYTPIPGVVAIKLLPPGGPRDVQRVLRMSSLPLSFRWPNPSMLQLSPA